MSDTDWESAKRCSVVLRLVAVAGDERSATTQRLRDAFSNAGAWLTDVHFFAGVQTVFTFEVASDRLSGLMDELAGAGVKVSEDAAAAIQAAVSQEGEVCGTLAVTFAHGDPDLTHEVPSVPG